MFWNKKNKEVHTVEITDANFDEIVLNCDKPILLDFWAPWCGPCKMVGPFIDELADEYHGRALVGKINVDQNPILSNHFKVKSIPTIMFMKDKELFERTSGILPKGHMQAILNSLIEGNFDTGEEE